MNNKSVSDCLPIKCFISHDNANSNSIKLQCLLNYLTVGSLIAIGKPLITKENVIIKILNSTSNELQAQLDSYNIKYMEIDAINSSLNDVDEIFDEPTIEFDSDEIPCYHVFKIIKQMLELEGSHRLAVPLIHMRYEEKECTISEGNVVRYKKFVDYPHFFDGQVNRIELRPDKLYESEHMETGGVPNMPLSSKWVRWPNHKIIFKQGGPDTDTLFVKDMFHCVYKLEQI